MKVIFWLLALTPLWAAADQILVLSGGGSPLGNHFSQYLQTKTMYDDLRTRFPNTPATVMFGAGNRAGVAPVLADVHRVIHENGLVRHEMLAGVIEANSAANAADVDAYFRQPALAQMSPAETLFLMVSDHGMPFANANGEFDPTYDNNCIDLWAFKANLQTGEYQESRSGQRCLSRRSLRESLDRHVSAGRVVFAMSQCYSGGFHQMSVTGYSVTGSPAMSLPTAEPGICGFTSTTEDEAASGCTPDVDGDGYQGFERAFTEKLTGVDVVSGRRLRLGRVDLREAFEEAAVDDLTNDIPLATSDFYLWKWALAIEAKDFRPRTDKLTPAAARQILSNTQIPVMQIAVTQMPTPAELANDSVNRRALDFIGNPIDFDSFRRKAQFFTRVRASLDFYPDLRAVLDGPLPQLEQLVGRLSQDLTAAEESAAEISKQADEAKQNVMTQWNQAVRLGSRRVPPLTPGGYGGLTSEELDLEIKYYTNEMPESVMLVAMAIKTLTDPQFAAAYATYQSKREILARRWAKSSTAAVKRALSRWENLGSRSVASGQLFLFIQKKRAHVRRLLIYRQVLGAWLALAKMADAKGLADLRGLLECESAILK